MLPAPTPSSTDHFVFKILNEIFGGYFGSRLMKNIREDKGFTYGIHSSYSHSHSGSSITIACDVNSQSVTDTFTEVEFEMNKLMTDLVTENELTTVKNYIYGSIQSSLCTPYDLMSKLTYITKYSLNSNYYNDFIDILKSTNAVALRSIAQKYFDYSGSLKVYAG